MENAAHKNVYTIGAEQPFMETLAKFMLREGSKDSAVLSQYRVLLPTRRACRILRETFLNLNDGKPILLPQMSPVGDVEEEDLTLSMFGSSSGVMDIPPAIAPLRRQILLAKLVGQVPDFSQSADQALALAASLAQFIDQAIVEGLDLSELYRIVPEDFSEHWQLTLKFMKVVSEFWPKMLEDEGVVDVAHRRNLLLQALCEYWRGNPPKERVIVAGVTGSIPAVAELLGVVAGMDNGMVILPGLDAHMDAEIAAAIEPSHPQFALHQTLSGMGVSWADVRPLMEAGNDIQRSVLASAMMLPADLSHRWAEFGNAHDVREMMAGLEYYSCRTQYEEAAVVSLIMRESLTQLDKVCALVTPDRALAMRVKSMVEKWNIEVDDSAGEQLFDSRLGKFIGLSGRMFEEGYAPVTLMALLKMSYARLGFEDGFVRKAVKRMEAEYLRQDYFLKSYKMLRTKIVEIEGGDDLTAYLDSYEGAYQSLDTCFESGARQPFLDVMKAHLQVMESLARTEAQSGADILWRGDVGEAAAMFFSELSQHAGKIGDVTIAEYNAILGLLMRDVPLRVSYGVHPRLLILGRFEARLANADIVIMGGLNEGIWPPEDKHDPWMSRPMRAEFGFPSSEQATGFAAHDFVQGFCAQKCVMTRSEKVDGSPSVPSRWLSRLETVLRGADLDLSVLSTGPYVHWAGMLDQIDGAPVPAERPQPCPPVSVRPDGVSITKVETWLQNPYAIYMYYVLRLRPLKPLLAQSDARLKGDILHGILDDFVRAHPNELPENMEEILQGLARERIARETDDSQALSYWWPSLMNVLDWFSAHEAQWREDAKFVASEAVGKIDFDVDGKAFRINGRADRIDRVNGGYALIDYKSGGESLYSPKKLGKGSLPQLPLEGAILAAGGFEGVPKGESAYMGYWVMTGRRDSGKALSVDENVDETIRIVMDGLTGLVRTFRKPDVAYMCIPDSKNAPRFDDYALLARVKEWTVLGDADEQGDGSYE